MRDNRHGSDGVETAEAAARREGRRWRFLLFFVYFFQKMGNHFEGVTKIPVRHQLSGSTEQGGFGLAPADAGTVLTASGLGWYIKALYGAITDRLPIFGYRRKSWLIISSLLASVAWFYAAATGQSSATMLLLGLMIANICIAFSDVVCDGLMVEAGQRMERVHGMAEGTGNRPLQSAQWGGAFVAITISAVLGGVIAQFFDFRVAAIISGVLPLLLIIMVALLVREERVAWNWANARPGFVAIALAAAVGYAVYFMKQLHPEMMALTDTVKISIYGSNFEYFLHTYESFISPLLVIGCMLMVVRMPWALIVPIALVFLWQAAPFNRDSQYLYTFFTEHNTRFLETLKQDTVVIPWLKSFVVALGIGTEEAIAKEGFQQIFFGSILEATSAIGSIFGVVFFSLKLKNTPMPRVFYGCIYGSVAVTLGFLMYAQGVTVSPLLLIMLCAVAGFVVANVVLAILSYAAERTPTRDQAAIFAFLMGMSNLGQMIGIETVGNKIYQNDLVFDTAGKVVGGSGSALTSVIGWSLLYFLVLLALVAILTGYGYITRERARSA